MLGMVSANLLTVVDRMMIGRLGDSALAAVGQGAYLCQLAAALLLGLTTAVQAMTARLVGEDKVNRSADPLNAGVLISLAAGLPIAVLGFWLAPILFPLLHPDPAVTAEGAPYVRAVLIGSAALGMGMAFQGFWNGIGKPVIYMRILVATHLVNIALNYILIFGKLGAPALGTMGAGVASTAAAVFGAIVHVVLASGRARDFGFLSRWPSAELLRRVFRLSIPSSIQYTTFSAGYLAFLWMMGQIGTAETAAAAILVTVLQVALMPGVGMGQAAATLVGQSLGRGEPDQAAQWGWDTAKAGFVILFVVGLPMLLIPDLVTGLFIINPDTVALARTPMRLSGVLVAVFAVNFAMMYSLLGAGAAKRVMATSFLCQWAFFLPAVYVVGPVMGYGLREIWWVQMAYGMLAGLSYAVQWRAGSWKRIQV